MKRVRQVAGGIMFGVMTLAVAAGAAYALWLGAPLLNPGFDRFSARDIPIINTDSKIVRPIPPADVSPRAGILQPAPRTIKPKATTVSRKTSPKRRVASAVSRSGASSARTTARVTVASAKRESDDSEHSREVASAESPSNPESSPARTESD